METAVILLGVVLVGVVIATVYFAYLGRLRRQILELIATVESTRGSGKQKMELVDYEIMYRIPHVFRLFWSKNRLEKEVQNAYDSMKKFAEWRRDNERKKRQKTPENSVSIQAVEPLMDDMIGMSMTALKDRAVSLGIDVEQCTDTRELIHEILQKVAK